MATLYGANKTKIDAMKPSNILDPGLMGGKVRCMVDTYTGLGTESAGDVIEMGSKLPVGARVLDVVVVLNGTGNTPDIGDYEDTDRYIDEATDDAVTRLSNVAGAAYEIDETDADNLDSQIVVTLDAAVTLNGVITVIVFYAVE